MRENVVSVPALYQGITGIAHGGYVAGLMARQSPEPVKVTLRSAPPLDTPLTLEGRSLFNGRGRTIMEAEPVGEITERLGVPGMEDVAGRTPHPRFDDHPYPQCFVCGTEREDGFGLRVSASDSDGTAAGIVTPGGPLLGPGDEVSSEFVWAIVDCVTVWAFADRWDDEGWWPAVTGQIAVRQLQELRRDRPYVAAARTAGRQGRRIVVNAQVNDADGDPCAVGRAVWVVVPAAPA
ncbi:MAG: hypothetical protein ACLFWM_05770 [Actinomycetota bacterium]